MPTEFDLASQRLAACLVLVETVSRYGQAGTVDNAYEALQSLHEQYSACAPVVHRYEEQLAALSDGPIILGTNYHSSAHEAALAIVRRILDDLYLPVVSDIEWGTVDESALYGLKRSPVTDPDEQRARAVKILSGYTEFCFEPGWIESLQERIRRERAKLTAQPVKPITQEPSSEPVETTWQDVAERLVRLCEQGKPYTSQKKLSDQLACSISTVHKAIQNTPALHGWAKVNSAPKVQSITVSTGESREPDPADEAAIREHLEREDLTRDERAFFNGLSRTDQLDFLNDPDASSGKPHERILGRKP